MKYRKKPVIIEAVQFTDDSIEKINEINQFMTPLRISYKVQEAPKIIIETLEGDMTATLGDYIIKGIRGEYYPCKPDIFESTYERVDEDQTQKLTEK